MIHSIWWELWVNPAILTPVHVFEVPLVAAVGGIAGNGIMRGWFWMVYR